ncbi:MAG: D-glycero-beta-D-manno-heptose-7-phosphate kinase [Candidatus Latescibacteria bacterium]|nr:D-glycero-beta-D-manno-heptose-7-phosphate kinase [Candidatus Latescibacterota bacterium]NIM20989.1 D-glycero-beta-D-manno-heptose-7-phosphate kinase [Candidatus Latescibacterota bacterium]NIM65124.1 D-glycero-beta-D-manno-heptose-7-phosphate kinase [Candidatus Latescibacterota bacterium]NIO01639.1 D-glycero-beta-D-manno-heptose-7-phosphate kinase [Candidatus Latescibacterota bacterium]NIO28156.1 D-glycero-beta-D-manno-heptose-7-phosphate kinase [Candidatus Latescibacterota bacterium]
MLHPELSKDQVASYMRRIPSTRVWVLGDVMLDRYHWGVVDRISPEAPVPVVNVTRRSSRLGGAANVAANLRALGAAVTLMGVVGADRAGEKIRHLLDKDSVDSTHLLVDRQRETTEKVRIIAQSQQVVRADFEVVDPIPEQFKEKFTSSLLSGADDCDALIISDYGKGVIQADYLHEIISAWRGRGKWLLIDPHVGHFIWYRGAGIVTPNTKEAMSIYNEHIESDDALSELGFKIKEDLSLEALLITRGESGMNLYFGDRKELHVPAVAKEVYDVTGAGDTVIGVLGAFLGAGAELVDSVIIANQAAGEAVKEVGTTTVRTDVILSAFK